MHEETNESEEQIDSLIIDDYQILNSTLVHLVVLAPPELEMAFGYDNFDYSDRNIPPEIIQDIYINPILLDVRDTNGFSEEITRNSIEFGEPDSMYQQLFLKLIESCPPSLPIDLTRISNRGLNNLISIKWNNKPKLEIGEKIVSYSRIVYSEKRDRACFYFENNCAGLCGYALFVFAKKESGIWKIENKISHWIS